MALRLVAVCLAAFVAACPAPPAQAGGTVTERVVHYAIDGRTGAELYAAIGAKGPKLGKARVIALTGFQLTWRRDYREENGGCRLASAVPKLIITTTLPKPSGRLPEAVRRSWTRFYDGVVIHERGHAQFIREMVGAMEVATIGLSSADDPGCHKVRAELTSRLKRLSDANRKRSAAFDREEMGQGGRVEKMVLDLVNGP